MFEVVVLVENNPVPRCSSFTDCGRISMYFTVFISPSTFTSLPGPAAEKHRHSMLLEPPRFVLGMLCFWQCAAFGFSMMLGIWTGSLNRTTLFCGTETRGLIYKKLLRFILELLTIIFDGMLMFN